MERRHRISWGRGCLLLALFWSGCAGAGRGGGEAHAGFADYFPLEIDGKQVSAQVAVRPAEMSRGLMERRDLAAHQGMLFVFARPQAMSFWMRNTPLPLDIGYFDPEGVLVEIHQLHPYDETAVESRSQRLQFALEVNQGWFRQQEIRPGARLNLQGVRAALERRGFEPQRFGL